MIDINKTSVCNNVFLKTLCSSSKPLKIYVCGPTTYDHIHIGNARPIIIFDFLIRYYQFFGIPVIYVMNITDIDQKIIDASIKENINPIDFGKNFKEIFLKELNNLNVLFPRIVSVVDYMPKIIDFCNQLMATSPNKVIKKNDGLYYDYSDNQIYYSVSKQNVKNLKLLNFRHKTGFAIWKFTDEKFGWNYQNRHGRPGWHTECAAIISNFFKTSVDIHGGGNDLKFPHHENENALFYELYNKPITKKWFHIGTVTKNKIKMAKSLGNSIYCKDFLKQWGINELRYFFLTKKATSPLDFNPIIMHQIVQQLQKQRIIFNRGLMYLLTRDKDKYYTLKRLVCSVNFNIKSISQEFDYSLFTNFFYSFTKNFNLPDALSWWEQNFKVLAKAVTDNDSNQIFKCCKSTIIFNQIFNFANLFIFFTSNQENLINMWFSAYLSKNFKQSDKFRKELKEQFIYVQ